MPADARRCQPPVLQGVASLQGSAPPCSPPCPAMPGSAPRGQESGQPLGNQNLSCHSLYPLPPMAARESPPRESLLSVSQPSQVPQLMVSSVFHAGFRGTVRFSGVSQPSQK